MIRLKKLLEGFDPTSMGPNASATEGTQENPYPAMNDKMRQMEENELPSSAEKKPSNSNEYRDSGFLKNFKDAKQRADELGGVVLWWVSYYIIKPEDYNDSYGYPKYVSKQAEKYFGDKYKKQKAGKDKRTLQYKDYFAKHKKWPENGEISEENKLPLSGEKKYNKQEPGGTMAAVNIAENIRDFTKIDKLIFDFVEDIWKRRPEENVSNIISFIENGHNYGLNKIFTEQEANILFSRYLKNPNASYAPKSGDAWKHNVGENNHYHGRYAQESGAMELEP
jgi:hypothetical protein